MYASNEDEFNREEDDWVFLRQTSPENNILHGAVNLVDHEQLNLSSSSSNSSSSSSKSNRSDSLSSLSSIEDEPIQTDDHIDQQESHLIIEDPVLTNSSNDNNNNNDLLLTSEIKEEILSSEIMIKHDNENETSPIFNEYDLFNVGCDINNESNLSSNNFRQRTGAYVQHAVEQPLLTVGNELVPVTKNNYRLRRNNSFGVYGFLIFIFILQIILGRVILSQRSVINKITKELRDTNKRLDKIKFVSNEDIEQKLTNKFEEKFQMLINQKMIEYNNEKNLLILKINELYQIINFTQENLTNMIHQLSDENEQLQKQVTELEHRVQLVEEQSSREEEETCPEGVDCTKSSASSLDVLLSNLIKQTAAIAENTSINVSDFFEHLSASLTDFVNHGHEYMEQSKQKLSDISGSQTAEQIQIALRRGVEHLSSSFRKAQSTYATWVRSRAQYRERARMDNTEQEEEHEANRHPWRWTFQRSHDRERMRHQASPTKKHATNKEHVCHSQYVFTTKPLSLMKNWMAKIFRS
ncbi:unnamed protein product [Rotaria sp. Silwood1]|nr:unnamed protein product [Rotaria sp. Silwood1]